MPSMRRDEVVDHPVGFGMARIEAVQLAVGDDIDAASSCVLSTTMMASRRTSREGLPTSQGSIFQKRGPIREDHAELAREGERPGPEVVEEVDAALLDADRDCDIKVLILKANGKGFCSGHAIGDNATDYPAMVEGHQMGTPWKPQSDLFLKPTLNLWEFSKPTIAQVHGYCVGGGTHFGLTTDIVIASEDAYFQYSPLQGFGMPSGECSIEPWVFMNWRRAAYYLYRPR